MTVLRDFLNHVQDAQDSTNTQEDRDVTDVSGRVEISSNSNKKETPMFFESPPDPRQMMEGIIGGVITLTLK
ncbi:hypothetical protein SK128_005947, partial [Halocaridina rubra]